VGHPVHKIKTFEIVGPYRSGSSWRWPGPDNRLRPVLEGELYGPLRDSLSSTPSRSIARFTARLAERRRL